MNVIITGATRGLGLALAKEFVEAGDTVYGISLTRKHWKRAKREIKSANKFHLYAADLTKEPQVKLALAKIIKKAETIGLVINNAGYADQITLVENLPFVQLERNIKHNLYSAFFVCKHILRHFRKKRGGFLINISSMAGKRAVPRLAAYSISKFGVLALSQAIAKENVEHGIQCITVCPGGMNTEMREKLFGKADAERQQSPGFVARVIMDIVNGKIKVESGGDIVIRHGKITAINPAPGA